MENKKDGELKIFIGNNYDKFISQSFNIWGFLFSSIYIFYRKMYLYGIITLLIQFGLLFLFHNIFLVLIINLLIGAFINKIYLSYAMKKATKIKENSKDIHKDEIHKVIEKKGGTSFISVLIVCILISIIFFILIYVFKFNNNFLKVNNKEDVINVSDYVPGSYAGKLYYASDVVINDEFEIPIPEVFRDISFKEHIMFEYQKGDAIFNSCKISMGVVKDYTSSEDLITQMSNYHRDDKGTEASIETFNDINWYSFAYENSISKNYYYATVKNERVYLLNYNIQYEADVENCEIYRNDIISKIKMK